MCAAYREQRAATGGGMWDIRRDRIDGSGNMAGGGKKTVSFFV
jgi:hypothetical protein